MIFEDGEHIRKYDLLVKDWLVSGVGVRSAKASSVRSRSTDESGPAGEPSDQEDDPMNFFWQERPEARKAEVAARPSAASSQSWMGRPRPIT